MRIEHEEEGGTREHASTSVQGPISSHSQDWVDEESLEKARQQLAKNQSASPAPGAPAN